MRSEIPQLEVITAIADAETEDFVSQLLYSQGWSIIYRAIDLISLKSAIADRGNLLRTVVIYCSDLPGLEEQGIEVDSLPTLTFINLDGVVVNSHSIMTLIRTQLRLPLIQSNIGQLILRENDLPVAAKPRAPKLITVTGTTGAPGRTHLAYSLANHLSSHRSVSLIDADLRSPSLAYLAGSALDSSHRCQLVTLDQGEKPTQIPLIEGGLRELSIVDIGALPPVQEFINDRRWQASLINHILESTSSLIFVAKSSGLSLLRLEQFIAEFPILLRKIPIIYILNQKGSTRADQAIEKRFLSLTAGEDRFVLPHDQRPLAIESAGPRSRESSSLFSFFNRSPLAKSNSRLGKEIGKIAELVA